MLVWMSIMYVSMMVNLNVDWLYNRWSFAETTYRRTDDVLRFRDWQLCIYLILFIYFIFFFFSGFSVSFCHVWLTDLADFRACCEFRLRLWALESWDQMASSVRSPRGIEFLWAPAGAHEKLCFLQMEHRCRKYRSSRLTWFGQIGTWQDCTWTWFCLTTTD